MNVFTTDLDRTFIFSERTVNRLTEELVCIEQWEGRDLSYVSQALLDYVINIKEDTLIIPVTTRALHQYERITLFTDSYKPSYAIAANGGVVMKNGVRDRQWDEILKKELQASAPFAEMERMFQKQWQYSMFRRLDEADGLFYVLIMDEERIEREWLEELQQEMRKVGWNSYVNGRKFYVLPETLTKEHAVEYILKDIPYKTHYAAGDSIMDLGMLDMADVAFTPMHGDLYKQQGDKLKATIVYEEGVRFTEMILGEICGKSIVK
jgi:hydroxymethylpyrimidine pyrophosphatase-like HAD family hydrolase